MDQPDFRALCAELLAAFEFHLEELSFDNRLCKRAGAALATAPLEPFVVRHYASDDYPSIKGNGFDGLRVGEDREEAEEFIDWVNKHCVIANPPPEPPKPPTDEELDEFVVFWWGAYTDESTVTDVIEDDNMADFARAALERWGK